MSNNLIKININNVEILTKKNITIIQACLNSNLNIDLPRFCFHEKLSIAGNCRMCLVEVLKSPKPVVACAMQVLDGMVIKTNTNLIKKAREGVLEFLLANHPLDCPICDQAGECDLQDQSMIFGGDMGRFYEYKRSVEDKNFGPLVKTVMTRCIHCTRCVRFLSEIGGIRTLGVVGRGNKMEIGTYLEKILNSELSGNIIDICPVGALTSKPYAFTARSWELISKESIDIIDSMSADIKVDIRGTQIMRILPRLNEIINENWLSDNSRFYYDAVLNNRLLDPYIYISDSKIKTNWDYILKYLWNFFYISKFILNKSVNLSLNLGNINDANSLIMLKEFNSFFNKSKFVNKLKNNDFRSNYLLKFRKINLLNSDLFILVGLNLRVESPLYNIRLRKLYLKKKILIVSFGSTSNLTYNIQHLGISSKSFLKFIEGNHFFCNLFLRSKNPIGLIGSNFFDYNNIYKLCVNIKKYHKNDFNFGIVNKHIGDITSAETNVSYVNERCTKDDLKNNSVNDYFKKNVYFEYLLNFYSYKNLNYRNSFKLFQGSHVFSNGNLNISLPGLVALEKNSYFVNLEGINRKTNAILPLEKNMRVDWQIIFAIILKYNNSLLKNKLFNLNKYYNDTILKLYLSNNLFKLNNNLINLIIKLLFISKVSSCDIISIKLDLNQLFYKYFMLYFNDLNFNINSFTSISPIFTSKLYHNISNFDIIVYHYKHFKLNNLLLNTYNDSFFNQNYLTKVSLPLSLTDMAIKKFDTNYI